MNLLAHALLASALVLLPSVALGDPIAHPALRAPLAPATTVAAPARAPAPAPAPAPALRAPSVAPAVAAAAATISGRAARADVHTAVVAYLTAMNRGQTPEPGLRVVLLKKGPTEAQFVAYWPGPEQRGRLINYPIVGKVDMSKGGPAGAARISDIEMRYGILRSAMKGPRF